ncbi:hypothetical protein [Pyxidicoccus xibeiensis]|uniref:hypothetical protein n=1 Tax=Pyxidicoccus xibeiensis TaxID=2906759 RepID=UPI0020A81840|nr:hypothetical protein [Pyxidicoccus xibeiensis]MCP3143469.1 hypothetical protein [Pyxidicoccus xibeiensis]
MRFLGMVLVAWCLGLTACGSEFDEPTAACAQSCAGCCSGDKCFDGTGIEACGAGGAICDRCEGLEDCADRGEAGRSCYFDRSERWRIQPVSAVIAPINPIGDEEWDIDGSAPDVVVELECPAGDKDIKTRTPEGSGYTPTWTEGGCTTTRGDLADRSIYIEVFDVDVTIDDVMFSERYLLKAEDFRSGTFSIALPEQEKGVVRFTLTRSP